MTLGQRIVQKRKELGLSQEALGEQLGVSRQAIYKWEANASLPEIDKLITLSKLFAVPVGWLLGVEDPPPPQEDGELTETQLQMVQEIVDRYQAAQPAPRKPVWDKWPVRVLFAMCGILLALLVWTNLKMKELDQRYASLANSIGEVSYSVNSQVGSIASRVERILKSQNSLAADWSAEPVSTSLEANTITFDVRVVPRTYVEGMTALFQARSGDDLVEVPVEPGPDHAFAGQITCPLSDAIDLTAVLVTGDTRETQWLDCFSDLYRATFPMLDLSSWFWSETVQNGVLPASKSQPAAVWDLDDRGSRAAGFHPEPPARLQVGLFQDQKLLFWYEEQVQEVNFNGAPIKEYVWVRTQDVVLEPGHTYTEAVLYTDALGRQQIYPSNTLTCQLDAAGMFLISEDVFVDKAGISAWEF